jgi:hypothetical protein
VDIQLGTLERDGVECRRRWILIRIWWMVEGGKWRVESGQSGHCTSAMDAPR